MTSSPATSSLLWASSPRRSPRSRIGTSRVGGRNGLGRTGPGREVSPERPLRMDIERADIERAARRIGGLVRKTPVLLVGGGAFGVEGSLTLKLEQLQHSGSFKARGAFNRLLSAPVGASGVVAASGGNHGAAGAYAARQLGHRAEVFVPEISSPAKVRFIEDCGAAVTVVGRNYAEAPEASTVRAEESGAVVVHAYDQPEVVAGQGTLGREIEGQAPELDTVLVAVGGAGLIGGGAGGDRGGAGGGGGGAGARRSR